MQHFCGVGAVYTMQMREIVGYDQHKSPPSLSGAFLFRVRLGALSESVELTLSIILCVNGWMQSD